MTTTLLLATALLTQAPAAEATTSPSTKAEARLDALEDAPESLEYQRKWQEYRQKWQEYTSALEARKAAQEWLNYLDAPPVKGMSAQEMQSVLEHGKAIVQRAERGTVAPAAGETGGSEMLATGAIPYGHTATGIPTFVGPRGGVFHWSKNSNKVYEHSGSVGYGGSARSSFGGSSHSGGLGHGGGGCR
jgi:hypothetical protein